MPDCQCLTPEVWRHIPDPPCQISSSVPGTNDGHAKPLVLGAMIPGPGISQHQGFLFVSPPHPPPVLFSSPLPGPLRVAITVMSIVAIASETLFTFAFRFVFMFRFSAAVLWSFFEAFAFEVCIRMQVCPQILFRL